MIEKMYGPEVFYDEAANALIPEGIFKKHTMKADLRSYLSRRSM